MMRDNKIRAAHCKRLQYQHTENVEHNLGEKMNCIHALSEVLLTGKKNLIKYFQFD